MQRPDIVLQAGGRWRKRSLELIASEFYFQRVEERDLRKARLKEKKEQSQNEALLQAIKVSSQTLGPKCEVPDCVKPARNLAWDTLSSHLCSPQVLKSDHQVRSALPLPLLVSAAYECMLWANHPLVPFSQQPSGQGFLVPGFLALDEKISHSLRVSDPGPCSYYNLGYNLRELQF